jgi:hypothetical protein
LLEPPQPLGSHLGYFARRDRRFLSHGRIMREES